MMMQSPTVWHRISILVMAFVAVLPIQKAGHSEPFRQNEEAPLRVLLVARASSDAREAPYLRETCSHISGLLARTGVQVIGLGAQRAFHFVATKAEQDGAPQSVAALAERSGADLVWVISFRALEHHQFADGSWRVRGRLRWTLLDSESQSTLATESVRGAGRALTEAVALDQAFMSERSLSKIIPPLEDELARYRKQRSERGRIVKIQLTTEQASPEGVLATFKELVAGAAQFGSNPPSVSRIESRDGAKTIELKGASQLSAQAIFKALKGPAAKRLTSLFSPGTSTSWRVGPGFVSLAIAGPTPEPTLRGDKGSDSLEDKGRPVSAKEVADVARSVLQLTAGMQCGQGFVVQRSGELTYALAAACRVGPVRSEVAWQWGAHSGTSPNPVYGVGEVARRDEDSGLALIVLRGVPASCDELVLAEEGCLRNGMKVALASDGAQHGTITRLEEQTFVHTLGGGYADPGTPIVARRGDRVVVVGMQLEPERSADGLAAAVARGTGLRVEQIDRLLKSASWNGSRGGLDK